MHLQIKLRIVLSINSYIIAEINKVTIVYLNLNSYREERVFLYIVLISYYNMILEIL